MGDSSNPQTPPSADGGQSQQGKAPAATLDPFFARVAQAAASSYSETFSAMTSQFRDRLLLTSFVLVLVTSGFASLSREGKVSDWAITITGDARWPLLWITVFLLIVFAARVYPEWKLWRITSQTNWADVAIQNAALYQLWLNDVEARRAKTHDILHSLAVLSTRPEELESLDREQQKLFDQSRAVAEDSDAFFEASNHWSDAYRRYSAARNRFDADVEPKQDALREELRQIQIEPPEAKANVHKITYAGNVAGSTTVALRLRLIVEVFFPVIFALAAIALTLRSLVHS